MNWIERSIEATGAWGPWFFLVLFIDASLLMIWRLECMTRRGIEGTVLGTLVMPYCSGIGNLIFTFILATRNGPGAEVMTNALVNNVTNMTLLIGLPAIFWGLNVIPARKPRRRKKPDSAPQIHRLSLLLTLTAVLFFTGAVWALARDGTLNFSDGLVLVGLFLFWQCFHVFEVLKTNARENRGLNPVLLVDLGLLAAGAYGIYLSVDWLVGWLSQIQTGFISAKQLGWLSGWLMVLPNGVLAIYYAWRRRPEIVYSSQVGDGHICIPLCVGIFPLFRTLPVPAFFELGIALLLGATLLHIIFVAAFGRLPRFIGVVLLVAYAVFVYRGLPGA